LATDEDWFRHLDRIDADEANFWQPSGSGQFRALQPGEPFLFKLHSPKNYVVGGGYFVRYSALPASLAWEAFGEKNGVVSHRQLLDRVRRYRSDNMAVDPIIGCNVFTQVSRPRYAFVLNRRAHRTGISIEAHMITGFIKSQVDQVLFSGLQ
jgi:putative restriction endonuclease